MEAAGAGGVGGQVGGVAGGQVGGVAGGVREGVREAYSDIARDPHGEHPLPVGRALAEGLGYTPAWLDSVPAASVESFAGVSCVPCFAEVTEASSVLDLGCGAGLDSLLLARRAASVLGVDFSPEMLARARRAAAAAGAANVTLRQGDAEAIPAPDGSIDVAVVNGVFNLNPARAEIFRELARVVRPGGSVYAAELILSGPLPPEDASSPRDWFA
jgi:SAM-dependent methyltransferase